MNIKSLKPAWWQLAVLIGIALVILWVAPQEATLGDNIKPVYIHVPLTIIAKLLFYIGALLGIGVLINPNQERLCNWMYRIYPVAWVFFLLGFLLSLLAAKLNWGNVPLQEPRFLLSMNVLVVGLVAGLFLLWTRNAEGLWVRLRGALPVLPVLMFLLQSKPSTWVLHPDTAMQTAPGMIRLTFLVMFVWVGIFAAWWFWFLAHTEIPQSTNE